MASVAAEVVGALGQAGLLLAASVCLCSWASLVASGLLLATGICAMLEAMRVSRPSRRGSCDGLWSCGRPQNPDETSRQHMAKSWQFPNVWSVSPKLRQIPNMFTCYLSEFIAGVVWPGRAARLGAMSRMAVVSAGWCGSSGACKTCMRMVAVGPLLAVFLAPLLEFVKVSGQG